MTPAMDVRVVRGRVDEEEIAALVVVLLSRWSTGPVPTRPIGAARPAQYRCPRAWTSTEPTHA